MIKKIFINIFLFRILLPDLKKRFQSQDFQSFISFNVRPFFVLFGCEYHIWYSHPIIVMSNTIENESKSRCADKQHGYRGENVKYEN